MEASHFLINKSLRTKLKGPRPHHYPPLGGAVYKKCPSVTLIRSCLEILAIMAKQIQLGECSLADVP